MILLLCLLTLLLALYVLDPLLLWYICIYQWDFAFIIFLFKTLKMKVKMLVPKSCPTVCNPRNYNCQAPLSIEFSSLEYWSGLPFSSFLFGHSLQACQISTEKSVDSLMRASQVVLVVKNPPDNTGYIRDMGLIPWLGRSPGGGHGNPPQYSCLENPMDRGAWRATVHRVAKSHTRLKRLSTAQYSLMRFFVHN